MKPTAYSATLLLSLASSALATGPAVPSGEDNAPKDANVDAVKWADPFTDSLAASFAASCSSERTFAATQYTLHDLFNPQPKGLLNWGESLKRILTGRPFPGDWDGKDPHQYNRHILKMKYSDVPIAVREWIEKEEMTGGDGKGLFIVYAKQTSVSHRVNNPEVFKEGEIDRAGDEERVAIFAPGAVYDILPLWVAEDSDCQDTLLDLSRYSETAADGAVVSWTTQHTDPKKSANSRDMEFTIKAEVLVAKPAEEAAASAAAAAAAVAAAADDGDQAVVAEEAAVEEPAKEDAAEAVVEKKVEEPVETRDEL